MRRVILVGACLFVFASPLLAQNRSVGAAYSLLSLTYPDQIPNGVGGWLAWDRADQGPAVGVDLGVTFFPEDHPIIGRQTQVLAGGRAGYRAGPIGLFARARPGLVHFSERFGAPDTVCILIFPPPESCLIRSTNFALDVGGTVEVYPGARAVVRVDVGDTLIRFARENQDPAWKHNFQLTAGAGLRF